MPTLVRPNPFTTDFDRLFTTLLGANSGVTRNDRWNPAVDLVEAEDHFLLKADLPGLAEKDVAIEVVDDALRISGERRYEDEREGRGWHRVERSFGSFSRSLTLPDGVDPDQIEASFDKGVLEIRIPKPPERKPRRIAIAGSQASPPEIEGTVKDS